MGGSSAKVTAIAASSSTSSSSRGRRTWCRGRSLKSTAISAGIPGASMMSDVSGSFGRRRRNETVIRPDDWNEYLLKVEGNRYVARLNAVQMVDYTDPKPFGADGGIALQLHSGGRGNMRFKDVLIRDLSKR